MSPRGERRLLQLALILILVLPFSAAISGVLHGPRFLGNAGVVPTDLDSHFRYLNGIFLAKLVAYVTCIPGIERKTARLRLLAVLSLTGGAMRLLSMADVGMPSLGHQIGLGIELGVVPAIVIWQARVARRFAAAG